MKSLIAIVISLVFLGVALVYATPIAIFVGIFGWGLTIINLAIYELYWLPSMEYLKNYIDSNFN